MSYTVFDALTISLVSSGEITHEGILAIGKTIAATLTDGGWMNLKRPQQAGQLCFAQRFAPVGFTPPAGGVGGQGLNDRPGAQAAGMARGEQVLECRQHRDCDPIVLAVAAQRNRRRPGPAGPYAAGDICQGYQRSPVVGGPVIKRSG